MAAEILGLVPTEIQPSSRERAQNGAIREVMERIKQDTNLHEQSFKIVSWAQRSSASGALYSLKGHYGDDATCDGFTMGVHPDGEGEGDAFKPNGKWVLIVRYSPDAIVDGALGKAQEEHKRREKIKADKYAANKKAKDADKAAAKAAGQGDGDAVPVPVAPTTTVNAGEGAEPHVGPENATAAQTAQNASRRAQEAKAAAKAKVAGK